MAFEKNLATINSRKFDSTIRRSWHAKLVETENSLLVFVGEFNEEVKHPQLGVIRRGTISYEFYWLDRWYNVFRFHQPNGDLRNFYCNINTPPKYEDGILDYIDLDIDVLVWKDFSVQILDLEEFEENAARYSYPAEIREKAQIALDELLELVKNKIFPFDYKF